MRRETMAHLRLKVLAGICIAGAGLSAVSAQLRQGPQPAMTAADVERELTMKVRGSFTLAAVGDIAQFRPRMQSEEPSFRAVVRLIQGADAAVGNFEGSLADLNNFDGPLRGFVGTKEVAADLRAMGFDLLNRANNHARDSEWEGHFSTNRLLEDAGIVHVGSGRTLAEARAPRYAEVPKGRIGMVGMHSVQQAGGGGGGNQLAAANQQGLVAARRGISVLGVQSSILVTREQLNSLKSVHDGIYLNRRNVVNAARTPAPQPDRVTLFGTSYELASGRAGPGDYRWQMNPADLREVLAGVRAGKIMADVMIATIHAHQSHNAMVMNVSGETPPDFLVALAHDAIDNGADAFVGHGPHLIRGIEIYKGKPIYYGLGMFARQFEWSVTAPDTSADVAQQIGNVRRLLNGGGILSPEDDPEWMDVVYESYLPIARFEDGKLIEIRVYPLDLRRDAPVSQAAVAHLAAPDVGRRILERVRALSAPFGTDMAIEGDVGVIRVGPSKASAP